MGDVYPKRAEPYRFCHAVVAVVPDFKHVVLHHDHSAARVISDRVTHAVFESWLVCVGGNVLIITKWVTCIHRKNDMVHTFEGGNSVCKSAYCWLAIVAETLGLDESCMAASFASVSSSNLNG